MKKTICILTATRAEYGLLRPLINKLNDIDEIAVKIAATGMHMSPEFGLTYQEIEQDGLVIDKKIEILLSADTPAAISKSMGLAIISFADYFSDIQPDLLIVLGDRYETLAVCLAAMNQRIPIAHLYGGETTEGAIDEGIRHAITKLSYLHFTSTESYKKRVIQLGEAPERVFCVGAIGIENIMNLTLLQKEELEQAINFNLSELYAVVTFHPVTLEQNSAKEQFTELLLSLNEFPEINFIFTKSNADADGRIINAMIDNYVINHKNSIAFESLGTLKYLSSLKYSCFVIGNSSSGIVEAPSFRIPTINIGERQKGRIRSLSVIDCLPRKDSIVEAIKVATSNTFKKQINCEINPYGDGITSDKIINVILNFLSNSNKNIDLKKSFYDI